jgi:hypothetical protein
MFIFSIKETIQDILYPSKMSLVLINKTVMKIHSLFLKNSLKLTTIFS